MLFVLAVLLFHSVSALSPRETLKLHGATSQKQPETSLLQTGVGYRLRGKKIACVRKLWLDSVKNCLYVRGVAEANPIDKDHPVIYQSGTAGNAVGCRDTTTDIDACYMLNKADAKPLTIFSSTEGGVKCLDASVVMPKEWEAKNAAGEVIKTNKHTDKDVPEKDHQLYCPEVKHKGKTRYMEVDIYDCSADGNKEFINGHVSAEVDLLTGPARKSLLDKYKDFKGGCDITSASSHWAMSCEAQLAIKKALFGDGNPTSGRNADKKTNDLGDIRCLCAGLKEFGAVYKEAKCAQYEAGGEAPTGWKMDYKPGKTNVARCGDDWSSEPTVVVNPAVLYALINKEDADVKEFLEKHPFLVSL